MHAIDIGIVLSSVCDAVHCGAQGRCRGLKVVPVCSYFLAGHFLFSSLYTFAL